MPFALPMSIEGIEHDAEDTDKDDHAYERNQRMQVEHLLSHTRIGRLQIHFPVGDGEQWQRSDCGGKRSLRNCLD